MRRKASCAVLLAAVALTACGGPRYAYKQETFETAGPFERRFFTAPDTVYAAVRRVVLRQGYMLEREEAQGRAFVASKQFQDDDTNTLITLSTVVSGSSANAAAWIAGQEVQFKIKKVRHTTEVKLPLFLGAVPIPTGSTQSLSKDRGETITDRDFYERIFRAVEKEIPRVEEEHRISREDEDRRLKEEIERRLRIEREVRAKLEAEEREAAASRALLPSEHASRSEAPQREDGGGAMVGPPAHTAPLVEPDAGVQISPLEPAR
ncbi:MAG: hypothetical protein DI596_01920 [Azospira oryzae]|uniref:DUF2242 domain-containing protein n=1 Tax=Pelomicrobium methylotrophicum TaxID=2602750 RepID=A0A5C7EXG7_9PROT|nr:DUF2242 domain-containing protein [Pelomicrobium methylotrophicum]PZP64455.1 MAG: hypothetical protein DI596_01920 [Azospira oryzae]PZP82403.1 MAG: hypothetical protein DI593_01920 [Azospira oryzae]TXF13028.1 DUF2242 domain-containing protein [Pelomicrobium methylotrophicum]